jgi:7-cyano-7-deazaguanine reductase
MWSLSRSSRNRPSTPEPERSGWAGAVHIISSAGASADLPSALTGQPNFATIDCVPDLRCVESKLLKLYLGRFRQSGEFHEACVNRIANDLIELLDPIYLNVEGRFTPQGGIHFWPTAEYHRPPAINPGARNHTQMATTTQRSVAQRALVLAPHHDDEAIGCGGLVAKLAGRGWDVAIVVLFAPLEGQGSSAHQRRLGEAETAAAVLGARRVGDLDLPSREPVAIELMSWRLVEVLRQVAPTLVLAPHAADRDPEHISTHRACVEALWLATAPFRPDLGPPMRAAETVLGYEVWTPIGTPQLTVDIGSVLPNKLAAIEAYTSQIEVAQYAQAARGLAAYRGVMYGGCAFGESYSVIEINENALSLASL